MKIFLVVFIGALQLGGVMVTRIVQRYQDGMLFRFGRVIGERAPGFRLIIPFADVLHPASLQIVTVVFAAPFMSNSAGLGALPRTPEPASDGTEPK